MMGASSSTCSFPSTVQFQGRWRLENNNRYATWSGSSLHFRTASRSISLKLGSLTASRHGNHNLLWHFGPQSETLTAEVQGERTLTLMLKAPQARGDDRERVQDVTIMLCDWGAALQVLSIKAVSFMP